MEEDRRIVHRACCTLQTAMQLSNRISAVPGFTKVVANTAGRKLKGTCRAVEKVEEFVTLILWINTRQPASNLTIEVDLIDLCVNLSQALLYRCDSWTV